MLRGVAARETLRTTRQVLIAWAVLSVCVTAPLPLSVSALGSALLPSSDVALALLLIAFLAWGGLTVHPRALWALTTLSIVTRAYLIADGITERYLGRSFHLFADLPLLPELVRLLHSIAGTLGVTAVMLGLCLGFWALWRIIRWAWRSASDALAQQAGRHAVAYVTVALLAFSLTSHRAFGWFSPPELPVVFDAIRGLLRVQGLYDDGLLMAHRDALLEREAQAQRTFAHVPRRPPPAPLPDVYLFIIEAYGHTVFTTPAYFARMLPRLREADRAVKAAGFSVCSDALTAPTFGAGSWLTHATLETGVHVSDGYDYDTMLSLTGVPTLARMFKHGGYRSVSVKPGTTRPSPQTAFYGFDMEYVARNLGYAGPSYAWSPMPDQYVLDALRKRELTQPSKPLFIEYALVSSHYPFDPRPPFIADWSQVGDGSIFSHTPVPPTPSASEGISAVAAAYLGTIDYDLRVLVDYLTRFVDRPALILIVGDHQPTAGVAGADPTWSVPLHVLSKDPELLKPWYQAGCTEGFLPNQPPPHRAIETLVPELVADFGLPAGEAP